MRGQGHELSVQLFVENHLASVGAPYDDPSRTPIAPMSCICFMGDVWADLVMKVRHRLLSFSKTCIPTVLRRSIDLNSGLHRLLMGGQNRFIQQTSKLRTQFGGFHFLSPPLWGEFLTKGCITFPRPAEELFPGLGEFVRVVGVRQLVFLERSKRALLYSCLENTLAIPFVRFHPRKGNPPPG
ncbi:hypothetical protein TNCV_1027841 [Trichonephila clavipes]|nr:hypothetical protein TNCV_1027841 [Trichonephila clavipes]